MNALNLVTQSTLRKRSELYNEGSAGLKEYFKSIKSHELMSFRHGGTCGYYYEINKQARERSQPLSNLI